MGKDRISSKNGLESYCFNMKTTIEDEKMKDKISDDDRKAINDKCDEAIKWLDANQLAEVGVQREAEGGGGGLQPDYHQALRCSRRSSRRHAWHGRYGRSRRSSTWGRSRRCRTHH